MQCKAYSLVKDN